MSEPGGVPRVEGSWRTSGREGRDVAAGVSSRYSGGPRVTDPDSRSLPGPVPSHELGQQIFVAQWVASLDAGDCDAPPAVREVPPAEGNSDVAGRLPGTPEKGEVPGPGLRALGATDRGAALIASVARQCDALLEQHLLDEARAVVVGRAAPAPQVLHPEQRADARLERGPALRGERRRLELSAPAIRQLHLDPSVPGLRSNEPSAEVDRRDRHAAAPAGAHARHGDGDHAPGSPDPAHRTRPRGGTSPRCGPAAWPSASFRTRTQPSRAPRPTSSTVSPSNSWEPSSAACRGSARTSSSGSETTACDIRFAAAIPGPSPSLISSPAAVTPPGDSRA